MRKFSNYLIIAIVSLLSCQQNFAPLTDSSVRDIELSVDMSEVHTNCADLFEDTGGINAFRITVYFYNNDGELLRQHREIIDDFQKDIISFAVPRIDVNSARDMVIVGDFVNVNQYGDVYGQIIHHKPESASSFGVYRLITDCIIDSYCSYAVVPITSQTLFYEFKLESVFSYVYVGINNASNVHTCKFQIKSKVFYDFLSATPTTSKMTTSGIRYNYIEDSGFWILQYVPDRNDNILDLKLMIASKEQNDTLSIYQSMGRQRIFTCLVDCQTMNYECF